MPGGHGCWLPADRPVDRVLQDAGRPVQLGRAPRHLSQLPLPQPDKPLGVARPLLQHLRSQAQDVMRRSISPSLHLSSRASWGQVCAGCRLPGGHGVLAWRCWVCAACRGGGPEPSGLLVSRVDLHLLEHLLQGLRGLCCALLGHPPAVLRLLGVLLRTDSRLIRALDTKVASL